MATEEVVPAPVRGRPFPKKSGSADVRARIENVLGPREAAPVTALAPLNQITKETALTMAQRSHEVRNKTKGLRAQVRAMHDELVARGWEPNVLLIMLQIANEGDTAEIRLAAAKAVAPYLETKLPTIIKGLGEQRAPATPEMQERVAGTLAAIAHELQKVHNNG